MSADVPKFRKAAQRQTVESSTANPEQNARHQNAGFMKSSITETTVTTSSGSDRPTNQQRKKLPSTATYDSANEPTAVSDFEAMLLRKRENNNQSTVPKLESHFNSGHNTDICTTSVTQATNNVVLPRDRDSGVAATDFSVQAFSGQMLTQDSAAPTTDDYYDIDTENGLSSVQQMIEETRKLCPYSRFCGTKPLLNKTISQLVPCCQDCECDVDCGFRGDCCHPRYDTYRLKDKYSMTCVRVKSKYSKLAMYKSYYMVNKCLQENLTYFPPRSRQETLLLHPAYSPTTKLIYYNMQFAICNDVNDAVNWTTFLSCRTVSYSFSTAYFWSTGLRRDNCDLDFMPPSVMPEGHLKCFESLINKCRIISNVSDYDTLTETMCHLITSPTSKMNEHFLNVHCLICNGLELNLEVDHLCFPLGKKTILPTLTFLIELSSLEHVEPDETIPMQTEQNTDAKFCTDGYIKHPFKDECRELKCPNGQYRIDRKCQFLSKKLYLWGVVDLQILMTPEPNIPVQDLVQSKGEEIDRIFKRAGLRWRHYEVLYSRKEVPNSELAAVNSILVLIRKKTGNGQIDLPSLIHKISKMLRTNFAVDIGGDSYVLKAQIDKGYVGRYDNASCTTLIRTASHVENVPVEFFYPLSGVKWEPPFSMVTLPVSKLFFCPMVKMTNSEFTSKNGVRITFPNTSQSKLLFSLDFLEAENDIYVCAYHFNSEWLMDRGNGMKLNLALNVPIALLIIIYDF